MVFSSEELEISKEKMDLILEWPILTNLKQVQEFLGATEYY